jgi:hypothetical protein
VNDVSVGSCVFLVSISCASEWSVHAALTLMAGRHPNSQANTRNYILLVQHDKCTCHSSDDSKAMPWWSSHSAHQGTRVKKKRYGWLLRDALTTQFHFGPRFSAVQPPSELIPKTQDLGRSSLHLPFFVCTGHFIVHRLLYLRRVLWNTVLQPTTSASHSA